MSHDTHAWRGRGSPSQFPPGPPASDMGGGVACTKYRLQGLAGAKIARAGWSGLRRGTRRRERAFPLGPFLRGRGQKGYSASRALWRAGRTLSRTREAAAARKAPEGAPGAPGRVQGSRVSAPLQLKAGGPSSVPVPKSEATWCTRITSLGAIIKYTSALPCAPSFVRTPCAHAYPNPVFPSI